MSNKRKSAQRKVMTVREVSEYLKIPVPSIYELTKKGKIRGSKLGKHWRYLEEDILNFLRGDWEKSSYARQTDDRRIASRINAELPAHLEVLLEGKKQYTNSGSIANLGEGGLFFLLKDAVNEDVYEVSDPVRLFFNLNPEKFDSFVLEGRIVHQKFIGYDGLGIKFRMISEKDKEVLRNYVG